MCSAATSDEDQGSIIPVRDPLDPGLYDANDSLRARI